MFMKHFSSRGKTILMVRLPIPFRLSQELAYSYKSMQPKRYFLNVINGIIFW